MAWSDPLEVVSSVAMSPSVTVTPAGDVTYILSDYLLWVSAVVSSGGVTGPFTLTVQGSVDGVTWYDLPAVYNFPYPAPITAGATVASVPVTADTAARYIRVSAGITGGGVNVSAYYAVPEQR